MIDIDRECSIPEPFRGGGDSSSFMLNSDCECKMRLSNLTISGFQCFGEKPTEIKIDDLTAIVGANGNGKSAMLQSLCRLFGTTSHLRSLRRTDFHINAQNQNLESLNLSIEARIELPELQEPRTKSRAVPECFNQMSVSSPGTPPFCRIRLEGKWSKSNTDEGDIEEELYWITSDCTDIKDADKKPMKAFERARIHTVYVPAVRDPQKQIKNGAGTILGKMLRAAVWSDGLPKTLEDASKTILDVFRAEKGISGIEKELTSIWSRLHDSKTLAAVQLQPFQGRMSDLLSQIQILFGDAENRVDSDLLSEGQRSLFYFALLVAAFKIENVSIQDGAKAGFDPGKFSPPTLTLFAVEEPENHLSPHYLRRICDSFTALAKTKTVQVLVTSHSSSILSRIEPTSVRHFRTVVQGAGPVVSSISLPTNKETEIKFIKEAVRAYPELYFAKLVVLCEGDSEEIVLPKLAEATGIPLDSSFVAIVPLAGRFVNHFWRLLSQLGIPYLTLLDLDNERYGGGWGRVKYASRQLEQLGVPRDRLYTVTQGQAQYVLTDAEVDEMHNWSVCSADGNMKGWIERLESLGVYFSAPLDLDFAMLSSFLEEYKSVAERGPQLGKTPEAVAARLEAARVATLKENNTGGLTYTPSERELFIWYSYLFISKSKPVSHLLALANISSEDLIKKAPAALNNLIAAADKLIEWK